MYLGRGLRGIYTGVAQWRLFARYLTRHQDLLPFELLYTVEAMVAVIESAIVWGYNLLNRISCSNGLVSNWWSLPVGDAWPWASGANNGLRCSNSATDAGAYGVRVPAQPGPYTWPLLKAAPRPLLDGM